MNSNFMENRKRNWQLITAITILTIVVSFIATTFFESSKMNTNEQSVYDKVISTGTIKACYIVTPPSLIKDPNSRELSGTSFDILEQAAENMGLELSWVHEVGWGEAIEALNTGKCDILGSAIWGNSNRAKTSEFIEPIYYSAVNAYVRDDDTRFDQDIKIANDEEFTLAVADGSTTYLIAQRQFPNANLTRLAESSNTSELIMEVVNSKADMTFGEASQVKLYQKNNPGKLKAVQNAKPVAIFEDVMLVKKGEFELKSSIDGAIRELIYGGFVDQVLDEYEEPNPGVFYRVTSPYVIPQQ
jgi:ABC-type amino acid transport substrate-binding protein